MEYTIKKLAHLTGVSNRTLRYYDQINLLKPKRINSAGYRIYGEAEIDRLQQILFFKGFGLPLDKIRTIMAAEPEEIQQALAEQHQRLLTERTLLDQQIAALEQNLAYSKGAITMTDQEKFEAMKQQQVTDNEAKYGAEARQLYGDEAVDQSNENWQHLTKEQYDRLQAADAQLIQALDQLSQEVTVDMDSPLAKESFAAHKEWLQIAAPFYTSDYHKGLGDLYLADERFAANYDGRTTNPSTKILRDIIHHYAK